MSEFTANELRKRKSSATAVKPVSLPASSKAPSDAIPAPQDNTQPSPTAVGAVKTTVDVVLKIARLAGVLTEAAYPYLEQAYCTITSVYSSLAPYRPDVLLPSLIGFILCFFGGEFVLLIAAVEAYRICGWTESLKCAKDLLHDFQAVAVASKKDDAVDDNHDGIPDVDQISTKELTARKLTLFVKTVDPQRFNQSLIGLNTVAADKPYPLLK